MNKIFSMKKSSFIFFLTVITLFIATFAPLSSNAAGEKLSLGTVSETNSDGYYAVSLDVSGLALSSGQSVDIAISYNNIAFSIVKTEFSSSVKSYASVSSKSENPFRIKIKAGSSTLRPSGKVATVYFEPIGLPSVGKYDIIATATLSSGETVKVSSGAINVSCAHTYKKHSLVSPTCTSYGYTLEQCTKCGSYRQVDKTDALGHNYKVSETVSPTCVKHGYTVEQCQRCSLRRVIEGDEPLGHEFGLETFTVVEPTCSSEGYTEYTCLRDGCDGVERTDITPMTPHIPDSAIVTASTCQKHGNEKYYCKYCTLFIEEKRLELIPHKFSDTIVSPTCVSKGYTLRVCTVCEIVRRENSVEKLGHTYRELIEREASCNEEGRKKYVCACGDYYFETIPTVEHSYEKESTIQPTEESDGLNKYVCSVCSHTYTEPLKFSGNGNEHGSSLNIEEDFFSGRLSGRTRLIMNIVLIILAVAFVTFLILSVKKWMSKLIFGK